MTSLEGIRFESDLLSLLYSFNVEEFHSFPVRRFEFFFKFYSNLQVEVYIEWAFVILLWSSEVQLLLFECIPVLFEEFESAVVINLTKKHQPQLEFVLSKNATSFPCVHATQLKNYSHNQQSFCLHSQIQEPHGIVAVSISTITIGSSSAFASGKEAEDDHALSEAFPRRFFLDY